MSRIPSCPSGVPLRFRPSWRPRAWTAGFGMVVFGLLFAACGGPMDSRDEATTQTASTQPSTAGDSPVRQRPNFYLGGIQVNEENLDTWLDALQARGMNTVSVTDYARQRAWDSDDLWWHDDNPDVRAEIRAAKARDMHVVLILRVDLDSTLEANRFLWHGMIKPTRDDTLASWFEKYTQFALRWAEVAERNGVDVLMIGSELNALASTLPLTTPPELESYYLDKKKQAERREGLLEHRSTLEEQGLGVPDDDTYTSLESYIDARIRSQEAWASEVGTDAGRLSLEALNERRALLQDHWQELIRRLRDVFSGRLGYAANFDQYNRVGFWPDLDVMGINAYFQLRYHLLPAGQDEMLYHQLEDGWDSVFNQIDNFRKSQGVDDMPVIFSEMGYTYRANSTLNPWAHKGFALIPDGPQDDAARQERMVIWNEQPDDLNERALAVRALANSHGRLADPMLEGILYWKLSTLPGHRDHEAFVVLIHPESDDPVLEELQRFTNP